MSQRLAIVLLGLAGWGINTAPLFGQTADISVDTILSAWTARQSKAPTFRYRLVGNRFHPPREDGAGIPLPEEARAKLPHRPPREYNCRVERELLVDLPSGRFRLGIKQEAVDVTSGKVVPKESTQVFNGTHLKGCARFLRKGVPAPVRGSDGTPDLVVYTGSRRIMPIEHDNQPVFEAHGIVRLNETMLLAGHLQEPFDKELFYIHGRSVYQDRPCIVMRTIPKNNVYDEFWVDPEQDFVILRRLICNEYFVVFVTEFEYEKIDSGWWPKSWRWAFLDFNGDIEYQDRMNVAERQLNPEVSDEDFDIPIVAGNVVAKIDVKSSPDRDRPSMNDLTQRLYEFSSDETWTEMIVVDGVPFYRSPGVIPLCFGILLTMGIILWFVQRSKRKPKTDQKTAGN